MDGGTIKIRFYVVDFASHRTWIEGYQREIRAHAKKRTSIDVRIQMIPATRWKWRMQIAASELQVAHDDDIVVVDGMLDVTPLVALLGARSHPVSGVANVEQVGERRPAVLVYLHENQLCTPFTNQDRDRRGHTHWHYGIAHWRSLLVCDGFVFNSQTQLDAFAEALPKLINEQCPRDTVGWHLDKASELLQTKCTVLHYGLELNDLILHMARHDQSETEDVGPTILWNARLEEDKDPASFLRTLDNLRRNGQPFRLIVLGVDNTKGTIWESRIKQDFASELRFLGWCSDRQQYAQWLQRADVLLSTAIHETFGISVVESAMCGVLPLLPNRLSYPELLSPNDYPMNFYSNEGDCAGKLIALLNLDPTKRSALQTTIQQSLVRFDWKSMGPRYHRFFASVANGDDLKLAGLLATTEEVDDSTELATDSFFPVTKAEDPRVVLYRPKSIRNRTEYQRQLIALRAQSIDPSLHGGRRAMVRMLDAIDTGSPSVRLLSTLTTQRLADDIFGVERKSPAPVYVADKSLIDTIRGLKLNAADAVLAIVEFPISSPLSELLAQPPVLVLEDVRNGENAGSILRSAYCLGIRSIVASSASWAAIRDTRSARCSMGTIYYQWIHHAPNMKDTLDYIRSSGCQVYGIEVGPNAVPISPHGKDRNWAMVLGNEDTGLSSSTQELCDQIVYIPQAHGDSLNVGHAGAIAMFELGREGDLPQHDGRGVCS